MKILYVNVIECNAGWGAEVFVDKGFRNLGHTTHCIDYRKHRDKLHGLFSELPEHNVFLLQRGDYFPIDLIESVRVPRFFWASELVSRCKDQDRLLSSGLFDHIFFRTKRCIETAVSHGWVKRDRCSILLSGFDETIHRMNSDVKRDIDLLFVGSITPRRKYLLEKLQAKFNVTIASAFGEKLVQLFQRSKIVLNIHAEDYQDTETRVFEVLGCGAFLLTERLSEENPFSSRQLVEFETFNELCDKIKYYLDHVNERETIAMRGYVEAVACHTYTHRADEIIRVMSTYLSKSSLDKNQYVHVTHDKFINITTNDAEKSSRTTQQTHPMAFHNSLEEQIDKIRTHLANIGKVSARKVRPRIFVAVHHVNWEKHGLVDGWAEIADVIHYDWGNSFDQYAADWHQKGKPDFNKILLRQVELAHREKTIDLFFSYLSGRWVYPDTIQAISKMNIITVNISLDDKVKFWGYQEPGGLSGNAEIAPEFDLCITTQSEEDVQKYISVGTRALFLPPGGNTHSFSPIPAPRDIPVSFVGQCYGTRPHIIAWLKSCGISVQTFGKGWPSGELSHQEMNVIYSRSVVNLGFGFIGNSPHLTGLKGRDFEVPLMGGLYLTTYNQDLENCFILGEEIDCYRNETDLLSKLQYYITHPDIALNIGAAGRNRCLLDHTWTNRFKIILTVTGLSDSCINSHK